MAIDASKMDGAIRVRFGSELANLYEVGWISADLSQVNEFAQLLEAGDLERADRFFGEDARPFNRYVDISKAEGPRPEIVHARHGSLEFGIAGLGFAATLISGIVGAAVKHYLDKHDETVSFEISPRDPGLNKILMAYADGNFGYGIDGLNTLFSVLAERNYEVESLHENVYRISRVVDRYSGRIVRTIRKHR
ncbi:MAG: hypothetical protein P8172_13530 [Gammaproteobacteria bacterium]